MMDAAVAAEPPAGQPPRATEIHAQDVTLRFNTSLPIPTKILWRESPFPRRTPESFVKGRWGREQEILLALTPVTQHVAHLAQLKPATRYYYRVPAPGETGPPAGWSPEYAVNTRADKGQSVFIRVPVRVLLAANVCSGATDDPSAPRPAPMSQAEIGLYRDALAAVRLFFWVNSRMKYLVDFDLFVDERFSRDGPTSPQAPPWLTQLPGLKKQLPWPVLSDAPDTHHRLYWGEVICCATRQWQRGRHAWTYLPSGGGTYGMTDWPRPARSSFLGGSDIAWLTCHEFKHQIESQYRWSGLTAADDRLWSCHFAARHDNPVQHDVWPLDTAADHGLNFDGLAWQMRHLTDDQYLRNAWGEIGVAADRDEDGLPDDDASLPLDEKRLGSDPLRRDSDGDGVSDLGEVLHSIWMDALRGNPLRQRVRVPYIRPHLLDPDSDGDGLADRIDPYPIYPFADRVPRASMHVDGCPDEGLDTLRFTFRHADLGPAREKVDLEIHTCYDAQWWYFAFLSRTPLDGIELVTDNQADGYYLGNDNLVITLLPKGRLANVQAYLGAMNCWPYLTRDRLQPADLQHAASWDSANRLVVELAIPRRPDLGLNLEPGRRVGMLFNVKLPQAKAWISVFEPGSIFDATLGAAPADAAALHP